jgi:CRP-like cAMP-binding protein
VTSIGAEPNRVLARIPDVQRQRLLSAGAPIELVLGSVLHKLGTTTTQYVFPRSGMISLTVPTPEGGNVEVALVGREGVCGLSHLLGHDTADLEAVVQVAGLGYAIQTSDLTDDSHAALRAAVDGYAGALLFELAQTAACNRLHSVEERTARWLLHAADRVETTDIKLTHDFLAIMLGVRRASVTVVVGSFQAAGLVRAERGRISLASRTGLLEASCSCYEVIRGAYASGPN